MYFEIFGSNVGKTRRVGRYRGTINSCARLTGLIVEHYR